MEQMAEGEEVAHDRKVKLARACAARIWAKQVKKVGITYFIFVFTIFFTL